jgi:hypothetical protein
VSGPLEGIDRVDWSKIKHCYGPATDVPRHLRALATGDDAARKDAWRALCSSLFHQGSVYEASSYVIPFLIRLAEHPSVPEREQTLGLAGEIGAAQEPSGPCWKALDEERERILALLRDGEPLVRAGAAFVLGKCFDGKLEAKIVAAARAEKDALAADGMLLALGEQGRLFLASRELLAEALEAKARRRRLAAAIAFMRVDREMAPKAARALVRGADPIEDPRLFRGLPWDTAVDLALAPEPGELDG